MNGNLPSSVTDWLFPSRPREFTGQRWINIGLRTLHLLGVAFVAGGFLFSLPEEQWRLYWYLTLVTGIALSLIYVWSTALWLFQLKGIAIIAKLVLLGVAFSLPAWRAELFSLVVIISGVIAHAPGRVRGYLLFMHDRQSDAGC